MPLREGGRVSQNAVTQTQRCHSMEWGSSPCTLQAQCDTMTRKQTNLSDRSHSRYLRLHALALGGYDVLPACTYKRVHTCTRLLPHPVCPTKAPTFDECLLLRVATLYAAGTLPPCFHYRGEAPYLTPSVRTDRLPLVDEHRLRRGLCLGKRNILGRARIGPRVWPS